MTKDDIIKERPILFSGAMVRALLDGSKTQTRRVIKPKEIRLLNLAADLGEISRFLETGVLHKNDPNYLSGICPYGQPGDRLWVRETWQGYHQISHENDEWEPMDSPRDRYEKPYSPVYRADGKSFPDKWFPAIHMPREYSRITLEIVSVRVERLNDISEEDAIAEGIENDPGLDPVGQCKWRYYGRPNTGIYPPSSSFQTLWESINGEGSWDANPWVWVVEFKRINSQD